MKQELYHFTQSADTVKKILESKYFRPSYCLEKIDYLDTNKLDDKDSYGFLKENAMAIPMVCFADLLDVEIENHSKRFGKYALVMSKQWALKNHLSPVIYTDEKAFLSAGILLAALNNRNELLQYFETRRQQREYYGVPESKWLDEIEDSIGNGLKNIWSFLMVYYKIYEGYQYNKQKKGFDIEKASFYLEREWRFIPIELNDLPMILERGQYEKEIKDDNYISRIRNILENNLWFEWDDILLIRIQEKDKNEIIETIRRNWNIENRDIEKKLMYFDAK